MKAICISALLPMTCACSAEQNAATRSFPAPCSQVSPAALSYLQHKGLVLNPDPSCQDCFIGKTVHLTDTRGHSISAHTALKQYTDTSQRGGKDVFGAWHLHTQLETIAKLSFESDTQSSCTAHLFFLYSWYATEFRAGVPVDSAPATRPSNLQLEKEYLEAMAQNISSSASTASH